MEHSYTAYLVLLRNALHLEGELRGARRVPPASSRRLIEAIRDVQHASVECRAQVDFITAAADIGGVRIAVGRRYVDCQGVVSTQQLFEAESYWHFRRQILWRCCQRCLAEGLRTEAFGPDEDFSSDDE